MALNYTNIFSDAGILIGTINFTKSTSQVYGDALLGDIGGAFVDTLTFNILDGLASDSASAEATILSLIDVYGAYIDGIFSDYVTMLSQLVGLGSSTDLQTVLNNFLVQMTTDSQTVLKSTITIGSVTAGATNNNTSTAGILLTSVLDGVQAPRSNVIAQRAYAGLTSQLTLHSETVKLLVTNDSQADGVNEGSEEFSVNAGLVLDSNFNWRGQGSGTGNTITCMNGDGTIVNGEFDSFSIVNTPDDWVIGAGTVGTNILQEISDTVGGGSALKLAGTATLTQSASQYGLVPLQAYRLACWVKGDATIAAGTLLIDFTGTGYSAATSEKINLDHTALAGLTGYTVKNFLIIMPRLIPADFTLQISLTSLTAAKFVKIDRLALQPVNYFGGIGINILAGASEYLDGDFFEFALSNDEAGKFQTFFRDFYGIQLPSSASPTIDDALVVTSF